MNLPNVFSDYFTPHAVVQLWLAQCEMYRKLTEMLQNDKDDKVMQTDIYLEIIDNLHLINEAIGRTN